MIIERREFLRLLGGATAVAVAGGFGLDQLIDVPDDVFERARVGPRTESWKRTVCGMCPGGCGLDVRLVNEIPVYVRGNRNYPVNFGGMCPLGHASIETLFNPDRLHQPLRRIGPPGMGRFEPVDWTTALGTISDRLKSLRSAGRPHEVVFLGTPDGSLTEELITRFMRAYGSPNVFLRPGLLQDAVPYGLTEGRAEMPAYDLLNASTVLSLGSDFLEEEYAPVHYTKLFSRELDSGRRRLIHAGPRMGLTAASAERWIPIRPGTYGALALGIAHVLIREELFDRDFIRAHTSGFEDGVGPDGALLPGFRTMVLEEYFPERVSEITGVSSEAILETARQIGIDRPSVVIGGSGVARSVNGTVDLMAVHALNALLGNFGAVGGIFRPARVPLQPLPPLALDAVAEEGLRRPTVGSDGRLPVSGFSIETFTANLRASRPYPVQVLFLLGGNPVFESISHHEFVEALAGIPLVVSFDSFPTETSQYADIVLPDHTFLEKWDLVAGVPSVGTAHVGIRQPVVAPLFDTRQTSEVIGELAGAIDPVVAAAVPLAGQEEIVRRQIRGLYEAGEGSVAARDVREGWLEYLRQRGWHPGRYDDFDSFWSELLDHGGWWNPIRDAEEDVRFGTPSGRFEFLGQSLRTVVAGGNFEAFMPHKEDGAREDGHPLYLVTFGSLTSRDGNGANLPLMQEQFGLTARRPWKTWVEINPETAHDRGIRDGDWVRLDSSVGSMQAQASVVPTVFPEVVAVPFGLGHTSYGRYASGVGTNPNVLIRSRYDPVSGSPASLSTRVTLSRIA